MTPCSIAVGPRYAIVHIHHHFEIVKNEIVQSIRFNVGKVIIFDIMTILQSMKKTASMKVVKDLLRAICQKLEICLLVSG